MYKRFFIFCNVFSFRYRTFSSFQVSFPNLKFSLFKSKVFFVQKQRFFCSKAKICSKVERFVLQKFFQTKISFKYRSCFFKSCVFFILNFLSFRYRSCFLKAFSFRYRSLFQMLIYFFFKFQFVFLLAATVQKQFVFF